MAQPRPQGPAAEALPHIITTSSDFLQFRERHALLIDKTALLQELVDLGRVFLARPRRFGKSLLVSMLAELFTSGTQHFAGMAIAERWHEPRYPVLQLSFLDLRHPATFERDLCALWRLACYNAGFEEVDECLPECHEFAVLAEHIEREVLQNQPYVVLIDEWDDPLSGNLHDPAAFAANSAQLRAFYTWLRDRPNVHFLLVTGIARYPIFTWFCSDFITDIGLMPQYGALVGYTEEELRTSFAPYLARAAALRHQSAEELLTHLCSFYHGFCFDGQVRIYNPWDINSFFEQVEQEPEVTPELMPFWMMNAHAPTALFAYLKAHQPDLTCLDQIKAAGVVLTAEETCAPYEVSTASWVNLLLQTGFLTITEHLPGRGYRCNFTNVAVENVCSELILAYVLDQATERLNTAVINLAQDMVAALQAHELTRAVQAINALLSRVNFALWPSPAPEARYRLLLVLFLQVILGAPRVRQAGALSTGRGDVAAISDHEFWAFELQLVPTATTRAEPIRLAPPALDQVIGMRYGQQVVTSWYGVVLVISEETHQVCAWREVTPEPSLNPAI